MIISYFFSFEMDPTGVKINTKTELNQASFRRLLERTIEDVFPEEDFGSYGFTADAALLLQQQTELFLVEMFNKGVLNSKQWERDTLLPRDIIIGLWKMNLNFDYLRLSQPQLEKPKSLMALLKKYKK